MELVLEGKMVERMKGEEEEKGGNWYGIVLDYNMCILIRFYYNFYGEFVCYF